MHARFKVAVARKHAGDDQIVVGNDFFDARVERPAVADASRAAITDSVKTELVEISLQVRFCSRYSVTTREPGASEVFTVGLTVRPFSTAFFATKPAASITLGLVVLVQAGNRRDNHIAVAQIGYAARKFVHREFRWLPRGRASGGCCIISSSVSTAGVFVRFQARNRVSHRVALCARFAVSPAAAVNLLRRVTVQTDLRVK